MRQNQERPIMKKHFLLFIVLLAVPVTATAQKRAFAIEDFYKVKSISDVHVAPDGKSVIYLVTTSDLPRAKRSGHIWMMDLDGKNARILTSSEAGEYSPAFSPDGKWISSISAKDGSAQLYVMSSTGGEAKKLTNISTGVNEPLWSPDGKWIAFSSDVYPECGGDDACNKRIADSWAKGPLKAHTAETLLYRHWTDWKDGTRTHLFLANAATGQTRDLTPGDFDSPPFQLGGPVQYDFSPDRKELVFVPNHDKQLASSTNNDLWLISLADANAQARNITAANPAYDGSPKYSPDGKYIAYRMQKQPGYESDLFRLAIYDRAKGVSNVLTESFRNWIDEFEWSDDSKSIYFAGPLQGQTPVHRFDLASKAITQVLLDKTLLGWELAGNKLVYARSSVGEPVEIFSADISSGKATVPTRLTHVKESVASEVHISYA